MTENMDDIVQTTQTTQTVQIVKEFDCANPWFNLIKEGKKIVEGRVNNNKYNKLKSGDHIKLLNADNNNEFVILKIIDVIKYPTFEKMLETETIKKVLPDGVVMSVSDGVKIYRKFYKEEVEIKNGVLAIHIELIK